MILDDANYVGFRSGAFVTLFFCKSSLPDSKVFGPTSVSFNTVLVRGGITEAIDFTTELFLVSNNIFGSIW